MSLICLCLSMFLICSLAAICCCCLLDMCFWPLIREENVQTDPSCRRIELFLSHDASLFTSMYLFCPCYEFMIMVLVYPQTSRSLDFTSWSIGFSFFLLEFLVCALKKHLRSICTWFGAWLLPYSTPPSLTLHPLDKRVWVMDVDFQRPVEFKSVNAPSCH